MQKTIYFDGKQFVEARKEELVAQVKLLKAKGVIPKLVSLVVGDEESAVKYQELKRRRAQEIGAVVEIAQFNKNETFAELVQFIEKLNEDEKVHGVMIQLPLPRSLKNRTEELINKISKTKDVDGMRDDSQFVAPVVLAVKAALNDALRVVRPKKTNEKLAICVVGAGFVGKKIIKHLKEVGFSNTYGVDTGVQKLSQETLKAHVIVSSTGKANLITEKMVKTDSMLIDVGAPFGEITASASKKAVFTTPVPGGIGPVTIYFLLFNLIKTIG